MEIALNIINKSLFKLIYFSIFGVLTFSTAMTLVIINLANTNYLETFFYSTISIAIICVFLLMPYWCKIGELFNANDKRRRANEIIEKLKEDPNYFDNGLAGDIPKGVISYIQSKLIRK